MPLFVDSFREGCSRRPGSVGVASACIPQGDDLQTAMITYQTGNPHFEGQTSFRVSETGQAMVEQTRGEETRNFAQMLGAETYRRLNDLLTRAHGQRPATGGTTPVPGENLVCIEKLEPAGAVRLKFWANQRWDNACLDALVHELEQAVTRTTDNEVKF